MGFKCAPSNQNILNRFKGLRLVPFSLTPLEVDVVAITDEDGGRGGLLRVWWSCCWDVEILLREIYDIVEIVVVIEIVANCNLRWIFVVVVEIVVECRWDFFFLFNFLFFRFFFLLFSISLFLSYYSFSPTN